MYLQFTVYFLSLGSILPLVVLILIIILKNSETKLLLWLNDSIPGVEKFPTNRLANGISATEEVFRKTVCLNKCCASQQVFFESISLSRISPNMSFPALTGWWLLCSLTHSAVHNHFPLVCMSEWLLSEEPQPLFVERRSRERTNNSFFLRLLGTGRRSLSTVPECVRVHAPRRHNECLSPWNISFLFTLMWAAGACVSVCAHTHHVCDWKQAAGMRTSPASPCFTSSSSSLRRRHGCAWISLWFFRRKMFFSCRSQLLILGEWTVTSVLLLWVN